jgi:hypothetical protein
VYTLPSVFVGCYILRHTLDLFLLPTRTASHAIQTFFLGVLALQLAFIFSKIFSTVNVWTDMASSLRLYVVDTLSLSFVIVWSVSKDEWRGRAVVVESYEGQLRTAATAQQGRHFPLSAQHPNHLRVFGSWLDSKYSTVLLPSLVSLADRTKNKNSPPEPLAPRRIHPRRCLWLLPCDAVPRGDIDQGHLQRTEAERAAALWRCWLG